MLHNLRIIITLLLRASFLIFLIMVEIYAFQTLHALESPKKVLNVKIDEIVVEKNKRKLSLYSNGKLFKNYSVALGFSPAGPKVREGDGKTPEGKYIICGKNAYSKFGLSLKISYPNEKDIKKARQLGVSPGGDIMIHGAPNKLSSITKIPGANWLIQQFDWSKGCISLTNNDMQEIYKLVPIGTVVVIKP